MFFTRTSVVDRKVSTWAAWNFFSASPDRFAFVYHHDDVSSQLYLCLSVSGKGRHHQEERFQAQAAATPSPSWAWSSSWHFSRFSSSFDWSREPVKSARQSLYHVIIVSDLADLWVIKIKKPMILWARDASRSREQSTQNRSSSESLWKVCLFYSHNNTILWLSNMADTFVWARADSFKRSLF